MEALSEVKEGKTTELDQEKTARLLQFADTKKLSVEVIKGIPPPQAPVGRLSSDGNGGWCEVL